jgi:DNA-binding FadR family transcriptional regulator
MLSQLYAQMTASVRESIDVGYGAAMANPEHITLHDELLTAIAGQDVHRAESAATRHLASVVAAVSQAGDYAGGRS